MKNIFSEAENMEPVVEKGPSSELLPDWKMQEGDPPKKEAEGLGEIQLPKYQEEIIFKETGLSKDDIIARFHSWDDYERFQKEAVIDRYELRESDIEHLIPRNGGKWSGNPGDSKWIPDDNEIPGDRNGTNPKGKNWKEIKEDYDFESIPFHDDVPDFSEVSKGQVEIEDFSDDRDSNFTQADEKLAEQRGCTPEEVAKWREEHKYTWHECADCKTMQKVPSEVHGNVSHSGGISNYKTEHKGD